MKFLCNDSSYLIPKIRPQEERKSESACSLFFYAMSRDFATYLALQNMVAISYFNVQPEIL